MREKWEETLRRLVWRPSVQKGERAAPEGALAVGRGHCLLRTTLGRTHALRGREEPQPQRSEGARREDSHLGEDCPESQRCHTVIRFQPYLDVTDGFCDIWDFLCIKSRRWQTDRFASSSLIWGLFSSLPAALRGLPVRVRCEGEVGHPGHAPDLRGKDVSPSPLSVTLAVGVSHVALVMLRYVPPTPTLLTVFCHERTLGFLKHSSCIC